MRKQERAVVILFHRDINRVMKKIVLMLLLIMCVLSGCGSRHSFAGNSNDKSAAGNSAEQGKDIYEEQCSVCHGDDGTAGISNAANLQRSRLDSSRIVAQIANGGRRMPAFGDVLTAEEIVSLEEYVRTLRK